MLFVRSSWPQLHEKWVEPAISKRAGLIFFALHSFLCAKSYWQTRGCNSFKEYIRVVDFRVSDNHIFVEARINVHVHIAFVVQEIDLESWRRDRLVGWFKGFLNEIPQNKFKFN